MKITHLLCCLLICLGVSAEDSVRDTLIVDINGEEKTIHFGQEFTFSTNNKPSRIKPIKLGPRYVTFRDIAFSFSGAFTFTEENTEGFKKFTFDGDNVVAMIHRFKGNSVTLEDLIAGLKNQYDSMGVPHEEVPGRMGDFDSLCLHISMGDMKMVNDIFHVTTTETMNYIIILQDMVKDFKHPSEEYQKFVREFRSSLKINTP